MKTENKTNSEIKLCNRLILVIMEQAQVYSIFVFSGNFLKIFEVF